MYDNNSAIKKAQAGIDQLYIQTYALKTDHEIRSSWVTTREFLADPAVAPSEFQVDLLLAAKTDQFRLWEIPAK